MKCSMKIHQLPAQLGNLPEDLYLVPLTKTILLPRTEIHIPLFDLRESALVASAIQEDHVVGFVQVDHEGNFFRSGCAGYLADIQDTGGSGPTAVITGLCRFDILSKTKKKDGTLAHVSYERYAGDIVQEADFSFDRNHFTNLLRLYCRKKKITPDWKTLEEVSSDKLLTFLMMVCPFDSREKQTLLETADYSEQTVLLTYMMEMDLASQHFAGDPNLYQ